MKKRLLASLLSLCLIVGLLPTAVLAAEEETGGDLPPVCTCEAHCAEGTVDETCPVCTVDYTACTYTAPVEPEKGPAKEPAEEPEVPVCAGLEGCDGDTHTEGCPLYVAPVEPEVPVKELTIPSFTTGQLGSAIDESLGDTAQRNDITSLTVSGGELNADDWDTMQNMTGLVSIDLSGATCENNEIPLEALNNYNSNDPENGPKYALTNFSFPKNITTIQNGAFAYCSNLTFSSKDWLPDTVITINPLAFQNCSNITGVDLSNVKTLGRQSFQRSGLTGSLILPDNLVLKSNKTIDNFYIFDGCTGLTEIIIGENITSTGQDCSTPIAYLGGNLFSGTSVQKLTIPNSTKYLGSLGQIAGPGCTVEIEDGVTHFGVYYVNNQKKEVPVISGNIVGTLKIPDSVIDMSNSALGNNIKISKLEYHGPASVAGLMNLFSQELSTLEIVDFSESGTTEFKANFINEEKIKRIDLSNCEALKSVSIGRWTCGGILDLTGCPAVESITFGNNTDGSGSSNYILALSNTSDILSIVLEKGTTLITNNGTFDKTVLFESGKLPTPIKAGYIFAGWYTKDGSNGVWGDKVTTPAAGKTYYAKWVTEINFDGNGGAGTMTAQQVTEGDTSTKLTTNGFTKTGYTFTGWNTKPDGNGTPYGADDVASTVPNGTTLYAQWKPNTYTIKFDSNGGTGTMADIDATYDSVVKLPANGFTKADHKFAGWAKTPSADDGTIDFSDQSDVFNLAKSGNVTLYAVWTKKNVLHPDLDDVMVTYNGQPQQFHPADGCTVTYYQNRTKVDAAIDAGIYDVEISHEEDNTYAAYHAYIAGGLRIEKAPLTVKAVDKTIRVGDQLPEYTYTVTGWQGSDGDTVALKGVSAACTDADPNTAGDYTITVDGPKAIDNYTITYVNGTLTVTKRSSGGGSSSGSSSGDYIVSVDSDKHGTVTVSPKRADKGDTVTITVRPDKGYELDELTVTDKSGDTVKIKDKGNGKFTFTMPGSKVTVEASFKQIDAEPEVPAFADVPADAYYAEAVAWAVKEGITSGTSATTFTPDASCTRAQMVTFLWRANGSPVVNYAISFTDVPADAYYAEAVRWAVSEGITTGTSADTFSPDATVSRAQAVTFIYRNVQAQGGGFTGSWMFPCPFTDVPADAYYFESVQWCAMKNITSGTSATTFSPDATCTRAQIVTFMYRAD